MFVELLFVEHGSVEPMPVFALCPAVKTKDFAGPDEQRQRCQDSGRFLRHFFTSLDDLHSPIGYLTPVCRKVVKKL